MIEHGLQRRKPPKERCALTHKFSVGGHQGYITVGLYPDNTPCEVFLKMSKQGSTVSGLLDTIAISWSLALQYGVPVGALVDLLEHMRFEPGGVTGNEDIPAAWSITDYLMRWLRLKFMPQSSSDAFAAGRPVAEHDPLPQIESDDIPIEPPVDALTQASQLINSNLTIPIDPTKPENGT